MGKFVSGMFLGALAIGLSIFTGSRTLDLLAWALPANQSVYQWLGLCAFEGGMLFWSYYFVAGAKGTPQRSISVCMAVFSIIAVAIATVGDLNIDAAQQGKVAQLPPAASQALIIFLGIVIVLNVAAYLGCHLLSIENMRQMKEQDAEDKIYEAGLNAISALAPAIAADAAPYLATEWANRTWSRIVPGVPHQTTYIPAPQQSALPAAPQPKPKLIDRLLGRGKPEELTLQQTAGQSPLPPSERTSNQIYRAERRANPAATRQQSAIAKQRQLNRQKRYARPAAPQAKSIDTINVELEETRKLPLVRSQAAAADTQGENVPMKITRAPGSNGKKPVSAHGATQGK